MCTVQIYNHVLLVVVLSFVNRFLRECVCTYRVLCHVSDSSVLCGQVLLKTEDKL